MKGLALPVGILALPAPLWRQMAIALFIKPTQRLSRIGSEDNTQRPIPIALMVTKGVARFRWIIWSLVLTSERN